IRRVDTGDLVIESKKTQAGKSHESLTKEQSHPSGPRRCMRVTGTHSLPHAHRCRRADAQRNHESKTGHVECNLVSCQLHRAQLADEKRGKCKAANLKE